jgi:hypothetical protein
VARVPPPSDYPASDSWGDVLVATTPPSDGSVSARFVSTASEAIAVGVVSFDGFGHASGHNVTGGGLDQLEQLTQSITALADVPSFKSVLMGAPNGSDGGNLLLLDLEPPFPVTLFYSSIEPQFGAGVAAGQLGGGPADDFVVLSQDVLHVYVDGLTTANDVYYTSTGPNDPCPISLSPQLPRQSRTNRAVVIGRFTGTAMQIAVGTPNSAPPGSVSIFDVDTVAGGATCALKITSAEARFGQSLAAGDFNGGGTDLLVGAPPGRAYLFHGPVTATPTAMVMPTPGPGVQFGTSMAALDVDGDGMDDALISDPQASVGSKSMVGNVTIFKGPMLANRHMPTNAVSVLSPHDGKEGHGYGTTVRAMPFCPTTGADGGTAACVKVPLVGESTAVFAYFTLGRSDPRAK